MLDEHIKSLSNQSLQLINEGFIKFQVEELKQLEAIKSKFITLLRNKYLINLDNLERLHEKIDYEMINKIRLDFYDKMNEKLEFSTSYLKLGYDMIVDTVGTELAGNKKVNFSIQMPNDDSSILPIHCDTFSGESEFQINLWIPLTDCFETNSMYIFNPKFSRKVNKNLKDYEKIGLDNLLKEYEKEYQFIEVKYGEGIIFTPTCLHGNILNKTDSTRISFNCRYKNIFSPYANKLENEKKLGSFYKMISPKAATIIGFNTKINY